MNNKKILSIFLSNIDSSYKEEEDYNELIKINFIQELDYILLNYYIANSNSSAAV